MYKRQALPPFEQHFPPCERHFLRSSGTFLRASGTSFVRAALPSVRAALPPFERHFLRSSGTSSVRTEVSKCSTHGWSGFDTSARPFDTSGRTGLGFDTPQAYPVLRYRRISPNGDGDGARDNPKLHAISRPYHPIATPPRSPQSHHHHHAGMRVKSGVIGLSPTAWSTSVARGPRWICEVGRSPQGRVP